VAVLPGIAPLPDGSIEFSVEAAESNTYWKRFGYLTGLKLEEMDDLGAEEIYIDACRAPVTSSWVWNVVPMSSAGSFYGLLDRNGIPTHVGINVVAASGGENASATIDLTGATIVNEDEEGVFLRAAAAGWGSEGSNGGHVTMNASQQTIEGDMIVDEISSLNLYLKDSSSFSGAVNPDGEGGDVYVEIEDGSVWTLTGDSYITSLTCSAGSINLSPVLPDALVLHTGEVADRLSFLYEHDVAGVLEESAAFILTESTRLGTELRHLILIIASIYVGKVAEVLTDVVTP
jgi:hypothetical protein